MDDGWVRMRRNKRKKEPSNVTQYPRHHPTQPKPELGSSSWSVVSLGTSSHVPAVKTEDCELWSALYCTGQYWTGLGYQ